MSRMQKLGFSSSSIKIENIKTTSLMMNYQFVLLHLHQITIDKYG